jgi:site-specific DNA-methyltransferase (adenine-specific)
MINIAQKPHYCKADVIGSLSFFNSDNIEIMKGFADNEFDLAIVDPPYGDFNGTIERTGGSWSKKYQRDNSIKKWDFAPSEEYFKELFRISKEQIIWGGNYFDLPPSKHFLIWEKQTISESFSMAMVEYAWSSINDNAKLFKWRPQRENGIHPTQKPVELYDWILNRYAKENFKIIDTHLGSGSISIAIEKANRLDKKNLQFTGIEINETYFKNALNRFEQYCQQGTLSF